MIKTPRLVAVTAAIAISLLAAPALTGCSVQGIIKNATGGQVDVGGSGSKPADFPSNVPLIDGKIITSAGFGSGKEKVWNVTVETGGDNPTSTIKGQLEGAGFTAEAGMDLTGEEGGTLFLTGDSLGIAVLIGKADGKWTANYTVTPAE